MNKKLKVLASILTSIVIAGCFAGCGSKKEATAPAPTVEKHESKEIVIWSHLTEIEIAEVKKAAEEWAKKTGNTVKVQLDKSDFQAYLQAANSSKAPDIMFGIAHDNLGAFHKAGLLAEVPEGIIDNSKYVPNAIDAVSYDKKMFSIPISMETYALFYNTDKIPIAPTTVEDLIAQGQKFGFQYDINNFYYTFAFIAGNGGYIFKNNGGTLDPKDIGLGNEGALKAYQLLADFTQKYKFMPATIKGNDAKANFQKGDEALYIGGLCDVDGFKKAGIKFAVAPLPTIDGKPCPSSMGVQAAFVNAKSKNQKEAWDLMKYLSQNTSMALLKVGNRIPVVKEELDKNELKGDAILAAFAKQAENAIPMPNIPEMSEAWKPVSDNLTLVTSGKLTPIDAGKQIVDQITQGIAEQK